LSQELKGKNIGYVLCKVHVWKWPVVKDKHIKMKPRIYILFVFHLDGECKFIKNKTVQLAATEYPPIRPTKVAAVTV